MKIIQTLLTLLALSFLILLAWSFQHHFSPLLQWIQQLGWLAPVLFITLYCLATLLFLPTLMFTLAGGALFGPFLGTLFNLAGATAGAAVSFLITRHFVYDWLSQRKNKYIHQLILGVEKKGWLIVALLRLFPILPFNLVNYGLGVTSIQFRIYLLTTVIFLIPAEIIYTYCGYAGMDFLLGERNFYHFSGLLMLVGFLLLLTLIKAKFIKKKEGL